MTFGSALADKQNRIAQILSTTPAEIASFKSGVDVFQQATGRPSYGGNFGQNQYNPNLGNFGQMPIGLASGLMGEVGQNVRTFQGLQSQKKDWADYLGQVTGAIGNLGSAAGGIAMCWVAREVYGEDNPKWLQFRNWLFKESPSLVFHSYRIFGPYIAKFIKNKPRLKSLIRKWMDSKI